MGYEERLELPPLRFGGLNTRVADLFVSGDHSPDLLNCKLHPACSMGKREGLSCLMATDGRDIPGRVVSNATLKGGTEGTEIYVICDCEHDLVDDDYVYLFDIVDANFGAYDKTTWKIEKKSATEFYLLSYADFRVEVPDGETWADVSGANAGSTRKANGAVEGLMWGPRYADSKSLLLAIKNGWPHVKNLEATATSWWQEYAALTAGARYCGQVAAFTVEDLHTPASSVYKGECLYVVNGADEPSILTAGETAQTFETTTTNTDITGGAAGTDIYITCTAAHGMEHGDRVYLDGVTAADFTWMNGKVYVVEVKASDEYYLLDSNFDRIEVPTGETWASVSSGCGTSYCVPLYLRRWPKGVYSATDTIARRGYPSRWDDPTAVGGTTWPGGIPDWPSGIVLFGQGVSMRLFAYGFKTDPKRVEHSELGVPWNFLKSEVVAASESAAATQPAIDGGFFWVRKGDGDRIIGIRQLLGYMVVYQRHKITLFEGDPGADLHEIQTKQAGATSDAGIIVVGDEHFFWSDDGPRRLTSTFQFGDLMEGLVGRDIIESVKSVNAAQAAKIIGHHDVKNQRVMWFVPMSGATSNTAVFCFYYPTQGSEDDMFPTGRWTYFEGRYAEMAATVVAGPTSGDARNIYGANEDGAVYQMDISVLDDYDLDTETGVYNDPNVISMRYTTRWLELGAADLVKRGISLDIIYNDDGAGGVKIYQAWDYDNVWTEINSVVSLGGEAPAYWDYCDWDDFYWDTPGRALSRRELRDIGRVLRLKFEDDDVLGVGVTGAVLDVRIKGKRG